MVFGGIMGAVGSAVGGALAKTVGKIGKRKKVNTTPTRGGLFNAAQAGTAREFKPYEAPDVGTPRMIEGGAERFSERAIALGGKAREQEAAARRRRAPVVDLNRMQRSLETTDAARKRAGGYVGKAADYGRAMGTAWDAATGQYEPINRALVGQYGDVSQAAGEVRGSVSPYTGAAMGMLPEVSSRLALAQGYGAGMGEALDTSIGQRDVTGRYLKTGVRDRGRFNTQYQQAIGGDYGRAEGTFGAGQTQLDVLRAAQEGRAPSVAERQLQAGMEDATRAQLSASLSGGYNPAAQAIAAQEAGRLQAEANRAAGMLRAEEIANARGQTSQLIGAQQGAAQGLAGLTATQQDLLLRQQAEDAARARMSLEQEAAIQKEAQLRGEMAGIEQAGAQTALGTMGALTDVGQLALSGAKSGVGAMTDAGQLGLGVGEQTLGVGKTGANIAEAQSGIMSGAAGSELDIGNLALGAGGLSLKGQDLRTGVAQEQTALNDALALGYAGLGQKYEGMGFEPVMEQYRGAQADRDAQLEADLKTMGFNVQGQLAEMDNATKAAIEDAMLRQGRQEETRKFVKDMLEKAAAAALRGAGGGGGMQ